MNVAPDGDEEKRKRKNITLTEEKHNGTLIISKIMMRKNLENRDNFSDEMLSIINSTGTFKGDQVEEAQKCVAALDVDQDGRVSYPEFLLVWKFKAH